jgi:hypothetical protein
MVGAGDAALGQERSGKGTEAALHSIAHDGAADLLRDGEAEADGGIAVAARPDEKDEAGGRRAQAAVRREEIRAAGQLPDLLRD